MSEARTISGRSAEVLQTEGSKEESRTVGSPPLHRVETGDVREVVERDAIEAELDDANLRPAMIDEGAATLVRARCVREMAIVSWNEPRIAASRIAIREGLPRGPPVC